MKVDFSQKFKDFDGKAIKALNGKDADLRGAAVDALNALFMDEQGLSGEDKVKRYTLAKKVCANDDPVDVTVEEVALIKKLVGKAFAPLIVAQAWNMLEGDTNGI